MSRCTPAAGPCKCEGDASGARTGAHLLRRLCAVSSHGHPAVYESNTQVSPSLARAQANASQQDGARRRIHRISARRRAHPHVDSRTHQGRCAAGVCTCGCMDAMEGANALQCMSLARLQRSAQPPEGQRHGPSHLHGSTGRGVPLRVNAFKHAEGCNTWTPDEEAAPQPRLLAAVPPQPQERPRAQPLFVRPLAPPPLAP